MPLDSQIPKSDRFENVEVLAVSKRGDGRQRVLKLSLEGRTVVLKCYGLKRGRLRTLIRQFGSLVLLGKSSVLPKGRFRTESAVLELWRKEGFDVPRVLSLDLPEFKDRTCLALEWIEGLSLSQVLQDERTPLDRKMELMERFALHLGKRHERALAIREPRLLVEHPSLNHVIISGERQVFFDMEIVFTRKSDLEHLIRRELLGYSSAMAKSCGNAFRDILDQWVKAYPAPARLKRLLVELKRYGTVPVRGGVGALFLFTSRRERYTMRSAIIEALESVPALQNAGPESPVRNE